MHDLNNREKEIVHRLLVILDNERHLFHNTLNKQKIIFSNRLLSMQCKTDRLRRSFVPTAIQLFNTPQKGKREN